MNPSSRPTPSVLERYEKKYLLPWALVEPISRFADTYCSLDGYSRRRPDGFYQINNLYLDSPTLTFLQNRLANADNRFNLRIRSYGEDPGPPYYCEIKQKIGDFIRKFRAGVNDDTWRDVLAPGWTVPLGLEGSERSNLELFHRLSHSYNAAPVILTNYRRKAYMGNHEQYARLTFDVDLKYMEQQDLDLRPDDGRMAYYDHEVNFEPGVSVILELKCFTSHVPLWMIDMVRRFELSQRSFSKYGAGVIEVMESRFNRNPWRVGAC